MIRIKPPTPSSFSTAALLGSPDVAAAQSTDYQNTQLQAKTGLPPFEYMEAPAPLPNYTSKCPMGHLGRTDHYDAKAAPA